MKKHDESYRLLFSVPRMIVELLRGFFGEAWIDRAGRLQTSWPI